MLNHSNKISCENDKHSKELIAVPRITDENLQNCFQNDLYIYIVVGITEVKDKLNFFGQKYSQIIPNPVNSLSFILSSRVLKTNFHKYEVK
jgi:hypothetical protein